MISKLTLAILAIALVSVMLCSGCRKGETESPSSEQTAPSKPQVSPLVGFDKDLQFIKNGQYTYIWVFSRKDGKPLDKDDREFLHTNAPQVVDWAVTDDKMKAIAGTNFNLEEGNLAALKKRYVAEDYSGR